MKAIMMFRGEQCWLEGIHEGRRFLNGDETQVFSQTLFELVAVENASVNGRYKRMFGSLRDVTFLPSSTNFSDSEWSIGVSNGKAK